MSHQKTLSFRYIASLGAMLLLLLSSILGLSVSAQDTGIIDAGPGQLIEFEAAYEHVGQRDFTDGILDLTIGSELVVDANSFTDNYNGRGDFPIASNLVTSDPSGSTILNYLPGSAESSTPGGTGTPGVIPIETTGVITFRARLRADALDRYAIGDLFNVALNNQGVQISVYSVSEDERFSDDVSIRLVEVNCELLARAGNATGGGFNGTSAQPVYNNSSATPNPASIGGGVTVSTDGLLDASACNPPNFTLDGASCTTYIQGQGFSSQQTGTVSNGVCTVNFASGETPVVAGVYQAVTELMGRNNQVLQTAPVDITFTTVAVQSTPRSGGISTALFIVFGAAVVGLSTYFATRQHRMKVD
jgi:hypothetical protein